MNRTIVALISLVSLFGLVAIGAREPQVRGPSLAAAQPDGCMTCHPKLSEAVPEDHFKPKLNAVKNCLGCHSMKGAATAFAWTAHQTHYAALGQAAMCTFCHQIDAAGNFRLIGVESNIATNATPATLAKMQPYYLSWATSVRLDRKHGERSVACSTCHDKAFPDAAVKKEKCFTCHGSYEEVARGAPFHYEAWYPHFGDGTPVECNQCHKAHEPSVNVCNQCHSFDEEVP